MTPTRADIPQIAALARLAGELLEAHGHEAWDTTVEWDRGVSAATLTGTSHSGGISDPTGTVAATAVDRGRDPQHHRRLRQLLDQLATTSRLVVDLLAQTNPALTVRPVHPIDESVADDGWCISCHRDDRWCEPISSHYSGKKLCRWCGDFAGAHQMMPPLDIIRDRHRGKRITKQRVEQAIQEHRADAKRKRRKGRAA